MPHELPLISVVRDNAEKDPSYNPYCLRCSGLQRMKKVAPFLWRHHCGAEHDERTKLERRGWAYFGPAPFEEQLDRIAQLIGSHLYEVAEEDGRVFVRRIT